MKINRKGYIPEIYEDFYGFFKTYNHQLVKLFLGEEKNSIETALEIGCGIGLFTSSVHNTIPSSKITAIDSSKTMISFAKKNYKNELINFNNISAEDFLKSKLSLSKFDLIFIKSAYHHFEDVLDINLLTKLLTEKGILVIIERTKRSAQSYPIFDLASNYWQSFFSEERKTKFLQNSLKQKMNFNSIRYGKYVSIPTKIYVNAIKNTQLSFVWPYEDEMILSWLSSFTTRNSSSFMVYEEYDVYRYFNYSK